MSESRVRSPTSPGVVDLNSRELAMMVVVVGKAKDWDLHLQLVLKAELLNGCPALDRYIGPS